MRRRSWWQTWRAGRWALSTGTRSTRWVIGRGIQSIKNKYIYTYSRMFTDNRRPAADDEFWRVLHSHQQSWDQQGSSHHKVAQDGLETEKQWEICSSIHPEISYTYLWKYRSVSTLFNMLYCDVKQAIFTEVSVYVVLCFDVSMFDFVVFIGSIFWNFWFHCW